MDKEISDKLKEMIDELAERQDIEILNKETAKNHIHILFRAKPTTQLSKVVNSIKGTSSRKLRQEFPKLNRLKSVWSPAYFLATTGEVTLDQLKKYVESQNENN